jgi:hypothetical protein
MREAGTEISNGTRPQAPNHFDRMEWGALSVTWVHLSHVLSDRATWLHFGHKQDLEIVVEGDRRPFKEYGVMLVNPQKHPNVKRDLGQQFIDYLISPDGQQAIADYKVDGQQLFYPDANEPGASLSAHWVTSLCSRIGIVPFRVTG